MNLDASLSRLATGAKVKLPEWDGYWFIPNISEIEGDISKYVRVFTKNGDILDTPWFDKYEDRTDFLETDGQLDFGFAIRALKNGKKVRRSGWNGKGMYLWLFPAASVKREWIKDPMLLSVFGDRQELNCLGSIRMLTATGEVLTGWLASQTDMLSTDWELAE